MLYEFDEPHSIRTVSFAMLRMAYDNRYAEGWEIRQFDQTSLVTIEGILSTGGGVHANDPLLIVTF
jgi:hypothetical protein